jgi:hypothetical protein
MFPTFLHNHILKIHHQYFWSIVLLGNKKNENFHHK